MGDFDQPVDGSRALPNPFFVILESLNLLYVDGVPCIAPHVIILAQIMKRQMHKSTEVHVTYIMFSATCTNYIVYSYWSAFTNVHNYCE